MSRQVDTPQNLYDFPANEFVAGFIGSPQMNFFDVRLKRLLKVVAYFGDNKIVVPQGKVSSLWMRSMWAAVVMGIRPENIHDDEMFLANSCRCGHRREGRSD